MSSSNHKVNPVLKHTLYVVIIAASAIFIYSNVSEMRSWSTPVDPFPEYDLVEQEDLMEECFDNFTEIAELLSRNDINAINEITCPLHGEAYLIDYEENNIVVSDPSPELFGYKRISVSTQNPELELVD